MSDHDHVWVCADNVTDGERNHPEGYVYCSECLAPKNKKWRVTVELPVEAPTATGAMDKVDAMFHLEQWRGMSAKPWRDDEYYDDLSESANTAHAIRFPPEYQPSEEQADDFPHHPAETDDEAAYYDSISRDARGDYDTSDPYDKEYDVP